MFKRASLLLLALALAALLSLCVGQYGLGASDLLAVLTGDTAGESGLIVLSFRLPRLLLALEVGAALAAAGVITQSVLRNDLATPGLMGVQAGGQAAVVLTMAFAAGMLPTLALPLASLVGAALAMSAVLFLAYRKGRIDPQRMILIGLALSMAIGAVTSVLSLLLPMATFDFMTAWTSGSFDRANPQFLLVLAPWLLLLPAVFAKAPSLDALSLGEETAIGLGVPLNRARLAFLAAATALSAACAAVEGGGIAFLGLIAPHIARRLVGPSHRRLLPIAMLVGMLLLVVADTLVRLLPAREIPAGTLVTLLGGPYFLWLLIRR